MKLTRLVAVAAVGALGITTLQTTPAALAASDQSQAGSAKVAKKPKSQLRAKRYNVKTATATGYGGAVTSVDPEASRIGLRVLKAGGNAVDAAVATAAALGVSEPYSSGIGGGGYFVFYNAKTKKVMTIDGRETAPAAMPSNAFIDPATGKPYPFTPDLVTSGVSVGVPGTLATWNRATKMWGKRSLKRNLKPATQLARRGFIVDETFRSQTLDNATRFAAFPATSKLFLPGGAAPSVGSILRNRDLAKTYQLIARKGIKSFYRGAMAKQIAASAQAPQKTPGTTLPVPGGYLTAADIAQYAVRVQEPTHINYRGYDVYGMAPSSSGGTTVGEALNIMEQFDLTAMSQTQALHHYLEASALAFADRGKYVGDPAFVAVPTQQLLSEAFAKSRACLISATALVKPVAAGNPLAPQACPATARVGRTAPDTENINTTNLTASDKWGNVVEYTLTIEQTGGSGIVVPGRGFLLNNELTDFSTVYDPADPNRIQGGKRPRSSMSPTIVMREGKPWLALGSPGGSTIITTVLQMLFNRIDRQMTLSAAIAAARASQRNTAKVTAEPAFITAFGPALTTLGHTLVPSGDAFTSAAEIGAATAIEFGPRGLMTAVSEPLRRGGGSALVRSPVAGYR